MLQIDTNALLRFSNMGLFSSEDEWIHPERVNCTYEWIFVVKGVVYIEEEEKKYELSEGELLCLRPNFAHRGYKKSSGVSFFWVHFYAENYERYGIYHGKTKDKHNALALMKNLNHLASVAADEVLIESKLLAFISELKYDEPMGNKLFGEVREYIRVNVRFAPKVKNVAEKFGYNADYLSKLFVKNCGFSMKAYIDRVRTALLCDKLLNTTLSLKELAEYCNFEDDNALIKFFTRRSGFSPTHYRNSNFGTHVNRE